MILEILQALTAFLGGGGTVLLGNYIRTSWGNRVEPPNTKESLAHAIERGHKLIETMGKDVLRLWHPPNADGSPCACAYCEIRGDDAEEQTATVEPLPGRYDSDYYEQHRDTPNRCCRDQRPTYGNFDKPWTCPTCGNDWVRKQSQNHTQWHGWIRLSGRYSDEEPPTEQKFSRYHEGQGPTTPFVATQVKNLETQMAQLAKAVGEKNQKIEALERLSRAQHDKLREAEARAHMWEHAHKHPGGQWLESFGIGPIRYTCPAGPSCSLVRDPTQPPGPAKVESIKVKCKACGESDQYSDMVQAYGFSWCTKCWTQRQDIKALAAEGKTCPVT